MTEGKVSNKLINLFLFFSLAGVLDSGYLLLSRLTEAEPGCFLVSGCDVVLKSGYSLILGVPVSLLGLLYYTFIFIGFFTYNFRKNRRLLKFLLFSTTLGLLATLWLLYLQTFVIGAFCSYCLISAITSIALFSLGMYSLKKGVLN